MEFINDDIQNYAEKFTQAESALLNKLNRETHLKVSQPRMLSGHLQGRLLSFISHMIKPSVILEIGTYTGYSALCLAEGLSEQGKLITIDPNEETNVFAQNFINESGLANKMICMQGEALDIIPTLSYTFDLVFIDADKKNYLNYFNAVIDKVNTGGYIIADNVLWSGKVLADEQKMDKETAAIHQFNVAVQNSQLVENILLPVRDGLMILRKK